jgi:hypothetical protein
MSVTIYRIEHKEETREDQPKIGKGAYNHLFSDYMEMSMVHTRNPRTPSIRKDVDITNEGFYGDSEWYENSGYYEKCFCACDSLKKLNSWFWGYKTALLKEDFVVVAYEVIEVVDTVSMKQVMFHVNNVISKKIVQDKLGTYIK